MVLLFRDHINAFTSIASRLLKMLVNGLRCTRHVLLFLVFLLSMIHSGSSFARPATTSIQRRQHQDKISASSPPRFQSHGLPRTSVRDSNDDSSMGNNNPPGLGFALPSLNQLLYLLAVWTSAQKLASAYVAGMALNTGIAINGVIFLGACVFLVKSLWGIDYGSLEGFETKSLANQAGEWALAGIVPTACNRNGREYGVATLAGGCFWGTELHFQRIPGVLATCVGYTQGSVEKPLYEQVCSGTTGHTEALQLLYDPEVCPYERLLAKLFDTIDPTLLNRVGNDRGSQYRHGVYTHTEEQSELASAFVKSVQAGYRDPVVTENRPAAVFWPAENYHQRYLEKGGQSAAKDCEERVRCYG